jgi:hypothetical protein
MDNLKDFTAQDARKNMNSLENSVNKKLLETILERINEKSKLNEESYSTNLNWKEEDLKLNIMGVNHRIREKDHIIL